MREEDEYRFNRGWLLNAGIAAARLTDGCDYFALHDIDLLPVDPRLPYGAPPSEAPVHLSPPGIHPARGVVHPHHILKSPRHSSGSSIT